MSRTTTWLAGASILLLSMGFAALNGGQRVTLRFGFATFYQVPMTYIILSAIILGMLSMLVTGRASDLQVRRILKERLAEESEEEQARLFIDQNQTNLFQEDESR